LKPRKNPPGWDYFNNQVSLKPEAGEECKFTNIVITHQCKETHAPKTKPVCVDNVVISYNNISIIIIVSSTAIEVKGKLPTFS